MVLEHLVRAAREKLSLPGRGYLGSGYLSFGLQRVLWSQCEGAMHAHQHLLFWHRGLCWQRYTNSLVSSVSSATARQVSKSPRLDPRQSCFELPTSA